MSEKMRCKDGSCVEVGDVIRWHCYDSDDFKAWVFTGVYRKDCIVYLGGGIDFGGGIGMELTKEEVQKQAEENDECERGVTKVGKDFDLAIYIKDFGG